MRLASGYDRSKAPESLDYEPLTAAEFLSLPSHRGEFLFAANDGTVRRVRASGALKTWKTRPGDFRLPVKYGMYESSAIVSRAGMAVVEGTGRPVLRPSA